MSQKIEYVIVNTFNQYTFNPVKVIIAKNLIEKQFGNKYYLIKNKEESLQITEGRNVIRAATIQWIRGYLSALNFLSEIISVTSLARSACMERSLAATSEITSFSFSTLEVIFKPSE